ncbi:hypothetical protein J7643_00060 [bacterium]|nr:hypothetical protein [bacterium]
MLGSKWPRRAILGLTPVAVLATLAYHPFWPPPPALSADIPKAFAWGISWHPSDETEGAIAPAAQMDAAQQLGVGLLRFDAPWFKLQPTADAPFDPKVLETIRAQVEGSLSRGMAVKVNLGNYPGWAIELLKRDPDAFFARYRAYVEAAVDALGPGVSYYQLGNEFNTILDPIPRELDSRVFNEARVVIDRFKAARPGWKVKTVINVCDTFSIPWHDELERVMQEASPSIDVVGYDFYPGNYSHLHDWSAWPGLAHIEGVMKRYGKEGAICETGCLTAFGEQRQARWTAESTRAMLNTIAASPLKDRFLFGVFYELMDPPKIPFYPTEGTFGLMTAQGRLKPGFEAFRQVVTETRAVQGAAR